MNKDSFTSSFPMYTFHFPFICSTQDRISSKMINNSSEKIYPPPFFANHKGKSSSLSPLCMIVVIVFIDVLYHIEEFPSLLSNFYCGWLLDFVQCYVGLIEWIRKYSFCFYFLEEIIESRYNFYLDVWYNSPVNTSGPDVFNFFWKLLIIDLFYLLGID